MPGALAAVAGDATEITAEMVASAASIAGLSYSPQEIDVLLDSYLMLTNYTGQPELSIPFGLDDQGMPESLSLTGRLFGESQILLLAHGIQGLVDHHRSRPPIH